MPNIEDDLIRIMRRAGIAITRESYIDYAYCGTPPEWSAELERMLPPQLQNGSSSSPSDLCRRRADRAAPTGVADDRQRQAEPVGATHIRS